MISNHMIQYKNKRFKIHSDLEHHLTKERVYIDEEKWKKMKKQKFFNQCLKWKIKSVTFRKTFDPSLLKQVQNIKFSSLTQLMIDKVQCETIEGIERIEMPNLVIIYFCSCPFSHQTFYKTNWPRLQTLSLYATKIQDITNLTKLKSRLTSIESFPGTKFNYSVYKPYLRNMSFIAKLKTKKLSIVDNNVAFQKSIKQCLIRKYPNLNYESNKHYKQTIYDSDLQQMG